MLCPACGKEIKDGTKFCVYCGHKLDKTCSKCGKLLKENSKFCPNCGNSVETTLQETMPTAKVQKNLFPKQLIMISRYIGNLGAILIGVSVIWWAYFWSPLVENLNMKLSDVSLCIFSVGGQCGFAAAFAPGIPYNPGLCWGGIVLLLAGVIGEFILKK